MKKKIAEKQYNKNLSRGVEAYYKNIYRLEKHIEITKVVYMEKEEFDGSFFFFFRRGKHIIIFLIRMRNF